MEPVINAFALWSPSAIRTWTRNGVAAITDTPAKTPKVERDPDMDP